MDILLSFLLLCLEGEGAWEMGVCMFTFRTQRQDRVSHCTDWYVSGMQECGSCEAPLFSSGDVCIYLGILADVQWLHRGFKFSWRLMDLGIFFPVLIDDYGTLSWNALVPILTPTGSCLIQPESQDMVQSMIFSFSYPWPLPFGTYFRIRFANIHKNILGFCLGL